LYISTCFKSLEMMNQYTPLLVLVLAIALTSATIHFKDAFHTIDMDNWVYSRSKDSIGEAGRFDLSHGKYFGDELEDKGIKTTTDLHFYQITAEIPEFSNEGKDLIIQYSVKHEQNLNCAGGYIKLFPAGLDQENFDGDSPYYIMFGPDVCGTSKKTHVIINYKNKNYPIKKEIKCEADEWTHLYTLIIRADNSLEVLIDGNSIHSGSIKTDFDILPIKDIKDPNAKKPDDWVDAKTIPDPEAKKPEGYDSIPSQIPDPYAKQPDDWSSSDGEWEPPMIANPAYKVWKPKQIPNPAYKGPWIHPKIVNPAYVNDDDMYIFDSIAYVGFEIWQVRSGTIFDNIIVTDNIAEANEFAEITQRLQAAEKKTEGC